MVGQPYTVTSCECGHTEALHASARTSWPHPSERGVCLVAGCDCKAFTPTSSRKEPRNEQGSQDSSNACRDGSDLPAGRHRDRGDITADREAEAGAGHGIGTEAEPLLLELKPGPYTHPEFDVGYRAADERIQALESERERYRSALRDALGWIPADQPEHLRISRLLKDHEAPSLVDHSSLDITNEDFSV